MTGATAGGALVSKIIADELAAGATAGPAFVLKMAAPDGDGADIVFAPKPNAWPTARTTPLTTGSSGVPCTSVTTAAASCACRTRSVSSASMNYAEQACHTWPLQHLAAAKAATPRVIQTQVAGSPAAKQVSSRLVGKQAQQPLATAPSSVVVKVLSSPHPKDTSLRAHVRQAPGCQVAQALRVSRRCRAAECHKQQHAKEGQLQTRHLVANLHRTCASVCMQTAAGSYLHHLLAYTRSSRTSAKTTRLSCAACAPVDSGNTSV